LELAKSKTSTFCLKKALAERSFNTLIYNLLQNTKKLVNRKNPR